LLEDLPEAIYVTRVDLDFPPVLQGFGATKDALAVIALLQKEAIFFGQGRISRGSICYH
jgi:hypothetical protein